MIENKHLIDNRLYIEGSEWYMNDYGSIVDDYWRHSTVNRTILKFENESEQDDRMQFV